MIANFGNISLPIKAIIGFWFLILFWGYGLIFVFSFFDNRHMSKILKTILLGFASLFLFLCFQCVTCSINSNDHNLPVTKTVDIFDSLPITVVSAIALIFTITGIIICIYIYNWNKTHITSYSIKEAVNTLPSGMAYYTADGRITLKNDTMDNLVYEITGQKYLNGLEFESFLKNPSNKENKEIINDIIILTTQNIGTWSFEISEISVKNDNYKLIIASDISEEYKLTEILKNKEKDLLKLNNNLVEYNKNLITIISEKERLNAKIKIHDELGLSLIEAKQYILNNGKDCSTDKLKTKIEQGIKFLQEETKSEIIDEYELLISTATDLGITINLQGNLPNENYNKHIVSNAMHECLTNVLKYSDANEIVIQTIQKENKYHIFFSTNVFEDTKIINPSGGLISLKEIVENSDGFFEISHESNGIFNIILNKEKPFYEI